MSVVATFLQSAADTRPASKATSISLHNLRPDTAAILVQHLNVSGRQTSDTVCCLLEILLSIPFLPFDVRLPLGMQKSLGNDMAAAGVMPVRSLFHSCVKLLVKYLKKQQRPCAASSGCKLSWRCSPVRIYILHLLHCPVCRWHRKQPNSTCSDASLEEISDGSS